MKSFHTTQKLSLMTLGLGMVLSAHAATTIEIFQVDCGTVFEENDTTFVLEEDITCSDAYSFDQALGFSGHGNQFFLQDHSITAEVSSEPDRGILITGDGNYVMGPGMIEGFGVDENTDGNIVIENAVDNHVSGLSLNEGENGVLIVSNESSEDGQANGNYIYHNIVNNPDSHGILVHGTNDGSAQLNYIYHNSIQAGESEVYSQNYA